ncbi:MAG: PHP domain-containing protein [Candidatus Omnitrophica bacterium]|nr:PHP domain-containing protein [Candidatus Omnitrophota bacterium]
MKFADLHLHTVYSDGTSTPEELVLESAKRSLSCIAVVDHDTVKGIDGTILAASKENIEVIPGIELSAEYNGLEIHILGYFIDYKNEVLINKLEALRQNRIERVYKITDKLKESGINLNPDSVFGISGMGTVGRMHIARAMVKEGFVNSTYEAFKKYIGDNCPAYVLGFKFSPFEAINLIKDFQGIPVLAHPYIIKNDDLILELIMNGIMGLEIYYPEHSQSMINYYLELAKKYNLVVTGGSDFHGEAKPDVKIGCMKLPYEFVEKMKEARQKNT